MAPMKKWFSLGFVIVLLCLSSKVSWAETQASSDITCSPMPEAVSSFGAVAADGWIYVYSGHIGKAHDHSKDNLSQSFRRRPLQGGPWVELPMETPMQGLALVAHDGLVYRIGGLTAKNAANEAADLYSSDHFAVFDPQVERWTHLAPLPAGRSSHDAVVIDGKLYVAGGWQLTGGDDDGKWHTDILVFDLANHAAGWQSISQPFERRALAASHDQGKLYVIGGMDSFHEISRSVDIYDPESGKWTKGPSLPGEGMNGFGVSAWNHGNLLLVSGSNGTVYRLSDDRSMWKVAAQLREPRFFHQLVPFGQGELLVLGGASRKGHLADIERIRVLD